jgi:hypothetical protein
MSRLEKLKELEQMLYGMMQKANSRAISSLARQYRETIREIEEIEGATDQSDEIAEILNNRDGEPRAVRKNRTEV